jgi:nicotinate-nucleotide pyrophosphorylase (carboxylating)
MPKTPHWMPSVIGTDYAVPLRAQGLNLDEIMDLITRCLAEDLDGGVDVTTAATIPSTQKSVMELRARKPGMVAGGTIAAAVFDLVSQYEAKIVIEVADGMPVNAGEVIMKITGPTFALLTAERTALNILSHLSGIATATNEWVKELSGTNTKVRDTRKTTPGLRRVEKYAVVCGGGTNHRMSLSDAALVKDNHIVAAGGIVQAFEAVRKKFPNLPVEVEVDSLDQMQEVVAAGADLVLLDNFSVEQVKQAVALNANRAKLEASGGLTIDVARAYAETGVDYLAVGAITHSTAILDIGADLSTLETN